MAAEDGPEPVAAEDGPEPVAAEDGPEPVAAADRPERVTDSEASARATVHDTRAPLTIRDARREDWEAIWPFLRQIVAAGETYACDRDMGKAEARRIWMAPPPARTVVATDGAGAVLGTANMYANRGGPGAHVASASFMVNPQRAGRGVGRALGEHVIDWARETGFRAIQFNAVVETNEGAVGL